MTELDRCLTEQAAAAERVRSSDATSLDWLWLCDWALEECLLRLIRMLEPAEQGELMGDGVGVFARKFETNSYPDVSTQRGQE